MIRQRDYIILGIILILAIVGVLTLRVEFHLEQLSLACIIISALLVPIYTYVNTKGQSVEIAMLFRICSLYVFFNTLHFADWFRGPIFQISSASMLAYPVLLYYLMVKYKELRGEYQSGLVMILIILAVHVLIFLGRMMFNITEMQIPKNAIPLVHLVLFVISATIVLVNRNNKEDKSIKLLSALMLPSMHYSALVFTYVITS